jgi:exodeoxyribonuclease-3
VKIATWNVNSIRARHDAVLRWLERVEPDVLCLQETKVPDDDFPTDELLRLGYAVAMVGQKSYNGVAIASRLPMRDVALGLADEDGPGDARLVRATIDGVRVLSAYVPNGKSPTSSTFPGKLAWFARLRDTLARDATPDSDAIVCGDFNVAPDDRDVFDPERQRGHLLYHPDEVKALAGLTSFGLVDVFRERHQEGGRYTWWDYRAGAFRKNQGFRIDLLLATRPFARRCTDVVIDVEPRRDDRPSDHAPVIATFA